MEYEVSIKFMNENGTTTTIKQLRADVIVSKCKLELANGVTYDAANLTIFHNEDSIIDFIDMKTDDYVQLDFYEVVNITKLDD